MTASDMQRIESALNAIDKTTSICIQNANALFYDSSIATGMLAMTNIKDYCIMIRDCLHKEKGMRNE